MHITLVGTHTEADNITTFRFKTPKHVTYVAGQFIQMTLPHDNPDERGIKHWFTLSSSPTDPYLAITTKFYGNKASTFKKALFNLQTGDTVEINDPEGDFILPGDESLELIFIAGGIGLTPYHSMIKYLFDIKEKRRISLLHAVQRSEELIFSQLFKDYGVEVTPYVGQRLTTEEIMETIGDPLRKLVYLSGPEPMVEALHDSLIKAGLPEDKLKTDYFPGYSNDYSH